MTGEVSGVLIVMKEAGMTSHDVVSKVRKLFNTKKVGHTGTLDPMATGVLPVLVGSAVKASEYLTSDEKVYRARMTLGVATDTQDTSGKVISESDTIPTDEEIIKTFSSFEGEYLQIPPMYSAIKVGGQKLYDLARQGIEVEREGREVRVSFISHKKLSKKEWEFDVKVSKGTYIRTLIHDIGERLSCGATMSALERRRSGEFDIEDAHTLGEIENTADKSKLVLKTESLFSHLKEVTLSPFYERLAKNGAEIYVKKAGLDSELEEGERVRMNGTHGIFFALGEVRVFEKGNAVKPIKFF